MALSWQKIQSELLRKVVDTFWSLLVLLGATIGSATWAYLKKSPVALLVTGAVLGITVLALSRWLLRRGLSNASTQRAPATDPAVALVEEISIGQEFWIPHGAGKQYRVDFPVPFLEPPRFEREPWPVPPCEVTFTRTKPECYGFTLITGEGRSEGDGTGRVRLGYLAKGRPARPIR